MNTLIFLGVVVGFVVVGMLAMPRKKEAAPKQEGEPMSPLSQAIIDHDLAAVEASLAHANPNAALLHELPALHAAIECGFAEAVPLLLKHGAAIDYVDPSMGSTLSAAIARQEWAIVKMLLDAKVPLHLVNEGGAHALHVAAYTGRVETVRKLLDAGAPIQLPNLQGGTALRSAASQGHTEVVKVLLEHGAEIGNIDIFGKSEIDYAHEGGHEAVLALLEQAELPAAERFVRGSAPFANLLPSRRDALLQQVLHFREMASESGDSRPVAVQIALSSIEAPSVVHIARHLLPDMTLSMPDDERPDPREPLRELSLCLWHYKTSSEGTQAFAAMLTRNELHDARITALASMPYLQRLWSEHAQKHARVMVPAELPSLLTTMASPPLAQLEHLAPWDAWFRAQVATAFIASYVGDEPWAQSKRRELLYEVLDGPADWANTAVIVALVDVARRDERAREDILRKLFETARRPVCPPIFQHIVQPAAWALDELGEEKAREEFREIIAAF